MSRFVCWYSCGAASAVAAKLTLIEHPDALLAYCDTGAEHPDNERFMADCVRWFNAPVTKAVGRPHRALREHEIKRLSNPEYIDTWHVWEDRRYIAGIAGAPCTGALKKQPRVTFQQPGDVHVFGYTAEEADRAQRFREHNPDLIVRTPLIERGLTKAACLAMVLGAGIKLPVMYSLGFQNNNCIPCPKATSPDYWAAIRKHFPEQFQRMVELSRELNARLARIGDERVFIDEIPADQPMTNPIAPACDFLCHIAEQDMRAA